MGKDHPDTVKALNLLIDLYEAWGKSDEVQKWRANLSEVKAEQSTIQVPKYMVPEENYKIPKELYPCVGNLKKIYLAIDKYHKENGTWPDWLSDLIPNYLDKDTLLCFGDTEHTSKYSPDPKLPCSYSWELSLAPVLKDLDPNGGTSYLDLKIQQTKLFGDVVPMIRCYHHGDNRALNISMGGQVYLSPLNWEDIFKKDHNFKEDPNLPLIGASFPEPKLLVASALGASWSPDGTCLVFCKWLGHRDGLQVLDIETGEMTDLTSSGKDPAWSPDGRFIAYVEGRGALEETWIVMSSGGTPRKIIDGGYPSWSVNGKTLYVHSRRDRKILAVTIDKPDAESEAFFDCPQSWYPAISPDSERVAFGRRDELVIANCQSKQIVLIWPTPGHRGLLCDWSPDGKKVAFAGFNDEPLGVWILDVESQEAVQVADESYNSPDWSPDGTKLAFERHADNVREIWMVETEKIRGPKVNAAQAAKLSKLILGSRVSQPATPVARPPENPLIGKIAPGFTLKDLNGQQISLSDFRGKVMLLDFWATWCGPCVKSIPNLEKLYTRYKDEGLVVLGLNDELDHAKVEQFAQGKISYTVLLDAKSQFAEYDIRAIPTLFYVDRQGMIRYKERGFREGRENEIEDKIKELLALEQITIQPIDPGVYRLIASYSMENNARDGSGDAYDGTLYGDPNFVEGVDGMAIALDGVDDYIELPIGKLIAEMSECTISIWVKWSGKGRFWQRIFDFGNSSDIYMLLTANNDKSGRPRFAITLTSYKTEDQTTSSYVLDFRWHHLAVTIDPGNTAHSLYIDGQLVDRNTAARYVPRSLGQTIHNWLGKSQFSDDPYFEGSLDEFRIYDRVLSTGEILYLAGHRKEVIPEEND